MRIAAVLSFALCLASCATSYQEIGWWDGGGVKAEQVTSDTWRIIGRGNGWTDSRRVQDFVLMKAAETTKAAGGTHFVIAGSRDTSRQGVIVGSSTASTTFSGNTASTTITPGDVYTYVKPGQDAYVRILTIPPGAAAPGNALNADEIMRYVGPRLKG